MADLAVHEGSTVCAAARVASATAPDGSETVIVDPVSGRYYGLDAYAVRVWAMIERPISVRALLDRLLEEYEVERSVLLVDLFALLHELVEAGLVDVTSGVPGEGSSEVGAGGV